jgi:thiamine-monophosphate kinase
LTSEFEIIQKYFSRHANDVLLGVGDDGAVVQAVNDRDLVVTSDTLVSGTHFSPDVNPFTIGYKSVAVNLSDLAAMGAVPKYITLSITLPSVEETWVREF